MPGLDDLVGKTFGPFAVRIDAGAVADFAAVTGDDPQRWTDTAPPMFANAVLFSAAPAFLTDAAVAPFTKSLIHTEQTYVWQRQLAVGEVLEVSGAVEGVRVRGPLNLVSFSLHAGSDSGRWLEGSSLFLMSAVAAAASPEADEPESTVRPPTDGPLEPIDLPAPGVAIESVRCGASRADLERYAAASGDSNPIHLDHGAARAAGLEGVIVHGLLMAAWLGRVAGRYGSPTSMRFRFRNPLRPAVPALIDGSVRDADAETAELDLALSSVDARLVTALASVTR